LLDNLYDQRVLLPLDDLIENYSTNYKEYQRQFPEFLPYLLGPDGRQYAVTSERTMVPTPNGGNWIRQDWLDLFGMPTPTNTAEVVEFMRRVRDEDPDRNGVRDTWGIGGHSVGTLGGYISGNIGAMFGRPDGDFLVQNGRFVDWRSTQGYHDYLEFFAMIYREGFLDPEFITDNQAVRQQQQLVTGKVGIYLYDQILVNSWAELRRNVPESRLVPFEPWTTSQGKWGLPTALPWMKMVVVNRDARNPRAVMAFLDWCLERDTWMTMTYGLEGIHYRLIEGVIPQTIDPNRNAVEVAYLHGNSEFLPLTRVTERPEWFPIMAADDPISQEHARLRTSMIVDIIWQNPFRREVPFFPSSDAIREFSQDTGAQVTALETDIVTGRVTVAEGIRQIHALLNSAGWTRINSERDAWLQTNWNILFPQNRR
jgi:putative aldouronate transport system substrate-binding protein